MANAAAVIADAFGRIREDVTSAVVGLDDETLARRPDLGDGPGNSIAWTVWHLSRVQDDHLAEAFDTDQVWTSGGWAERFALPFDDAATGYGQSTEEVGQVRARAEDLIGYHDAVTGRTLQLLDGLTDDELERVLPGTWGDGITLAVRLVSVIGDDMQHIGQAAYLRGLFGPSGR
ncbi:MAG: DinB family protein [Actinomycetota bacterium]|nr:DinB family protein [Actinomycetota bacterium]